MRNAKLASIPGAQAKNPGLTVTVNCADLNEVMVCAASFDGLIKAGKAKFDGDRKGCAYTRARSRQEVPRRKCSINEEILVHEQATKKCTGHRRRSGGPRRGFDGLHDDLRHRR
jgi:hypothetical protein